MAVINKEGGIGALLQVLALKLPAAVAFLIPVVAVFEKKLMPVFLIVILLACFVLVRPFRPRFWMPLLFAAGALLLWALSSALWSIDPDHSLSRFGRLAPTVVIGLLICGLAASRDAAGRRDAGLWFALGLLVASALALAAPMLRDLFSGGALAEVFAEMSLFSFGAVAVLGGFILLGLIDDPRVRHAALVAMVFAVIAVFLRGNSASALAVVAGAAAFIVILLAGRKAAFVLAVALPCAFWTLPVALQTVDVPAQLKDAGLRLDASTGHRLIVWRFVLGEIEERPVLGMGLHTARILPDRRRLDPDNPDYADILDVTDFRPGANIELMPMHPHNATFQTWLELGFVGAGLFGILYGLCLWAAARTGLSRPAIAAAGGGIVAAFVIGQLSFSAWQSWWLCAQFLAAAGFLYLARKETAPP